MQSVAVQIRERVALHCMALLHLCDPTQAQWIWGEERGKGYVTKQFALYFYRHKN